MGDICRMGILLRVSEEEAQLIYYIKREKVALSDSFHDLIMDKIGEVTKKMIKKEC